VFGPTAVGSAAANPPVLIAGTANAGATGNVQVAKVSASGLVSVDGSAVTQPVSGAVKVTDGTNNAAVKAASTAPATTDPAVVVSISPNSVNPNGQATMANSVSVAIASNQSAIPVSGSFSATGFTPGLTFANLTATASSASVALPTGATVYFQNNGTTTVSCTLGIGSATAVASEILVPASSGVPVVVGSNTFGACIDQSGSASNLVVLAGGSGLGNAFGGGSSGGGGGGAITAASGAYASGSISAGAYAAGAVVAGAFVDGWDATQGTKADTAWVSGSGSVIALLKNIAGGIAGAPPINVNGTPTAWTGLTPGSAQTGTIIAPNTDQTSMGGVAYGAMANFGTSPGAVKAPNANASLFYGTVAAVGDPCMTATKTYTPVNVVTATNVIIAGVSAKKKYVCGIFLYPGGTDNIAVYQATTGTSCATAPADIFGGHTTGTGFLATATAGFVVGNGASSIAATNTVNTDICVTTSAAVQLSGVVVTVDQ